MSNTESENLSKIRQLILNQNDLTTEEKETLLNELENMYELKKRMSNYELMQSNVKLLKKQIEKLNQNWQAIKGYASDGYLIDKDTDGRYDPLHAGLRDGFVNIIKEMDKLDGTNSLKELREL